jgi:uncharacterized iron-regulated membrane protein
MAGRAAIRASDADREHVAERLRRAAGEGRLHTEELEQRLEAAFGARTYGQLDSVLTDLPGRRPTVASQALTIHPRGAVGVALAMLATLAVLVTVVFVVTGVFAGWLLWSAFGWLFMRGRRGARRAHARGYSGSLHMCGFGTRGRPRGYSS